MNLQDLRRRVCGLPDKNGATGPTWINPKEAIYLLDTIDSMQSRLESLEKDAARLDWMIDEQVFMEYERDNYWLVFPDGSGQSQSHKSGREAIDTAMQAAK